MMMAYGLFVFGLSTAAYDELQQDMAWRHESSDRVGARPVSQFLGVGEETIRLPGQLLPEITGGQQNLDDLRDMADRGYAWPLIEGTGRHYGLFVITRINNRKSAFFDNGAAARIDFEINLKRVDDDRRYRVGTVEEMLRSQIGRDIGERLRRQFG